MPTPSQLPTFSPRGPGSLDMSVQNILDLISKSGQQSLTNIALPPIENILGQQGAFIAPQIAAIRGRGEELAAGAQSDAMKRGLTGSDIEAAGMLGARQGAAQQEAELRGQVGMQQAASLAQMLFQALGMDIGQNREMFLNLAQALGQELTAQREREMFERLLQEGMAESGRQARHAQQSQLVKGSFDIAQELIKAGLGS